MIEGGSKTNVTPTHARAQLVAVFFLVKILSNLLLHWRSLWMILKYVFLFF